MIVRSHKEFVPERFTRFDVYWIQTHIRQGKFRVLIVAQSFSFFSSIENNNKIHGFSIFSVFSEFLENFFAHCYMLIYKVQRSDHVGQLNSTFSDSLNTNCCGKH